MKLMQSILVACALLASGPDSDAAFRDLYRQPPELQKNYFYLTVGTVAPQHRQTLANVLRFVLPSMSSKSYLPDQLPVPVPGSNLMRADMVGLGWEHTWPKVIAEHYTPLFRPDLPKGHTPLVVNGLWVAAALTDANLTGDAIYQLTYNGKPPKTLAEFEAFHKVNGDPFLTFGRMEGESGVSVAGERVIQNKPVSNRGFYWLTLDSRVVAGATDQLENIAKKNIKHDASEALAGLPKHVNGEGGSLMTGFLANGEGKRQERAPADIVRDDTRLRGVEIRNVVSCLGCHLEGMRHPTLDKYRSYIQSGARIYIKEKATQLEVDRYFQSPVAKEIERNNADYAAAIRLCNGLTPQANALAYRQMVQLYDAPLGLDQQAREIYATSTDEWRLALGNYSRTYQLTGRLALAAQGQQITRDQWSANFYLAQRVWAAWHPK